MYFVAVFKALGACMVQTIQIIDRKHIQTDRKRNITFTLRLKHKWFNILEKNCTKPDMGFVSIDNFLFAESDNIHILSVCAVFFPMLLFLISPQAMFSILLYIIILPIRQYGKVPEFAVTEIPKALVRKTAFLVQYLVHIFYFNCTCAPAYQLCTLLPITTKLWPGHKCESKH